MTYAYRWVVQQACQVMILVVVLAAAPVFGQPGDEGFIEYLRRQDPAAAERFVALRNARDAALADYRQASERYSAGGPALRSVSLPALQQAKRRYAEASLALLDFLDERDRGLITKLEADIARVKRTLEERARDRTELQRMLRGE
jgi:hypothetical protein